MRSEWRVPGIARICTTRGVLHSGAAFSFPSAPTCKRGFRQLVDTEDGGRLFPSGCRPLRGSPAFPSNGSEKERKARIGKLSSWSSFQNRHLEAFSPPRVPRPQRGRPAGARGHHPGHAGGGRAAGGGGAGEGAADAGKGNSGSAREPAVTGTSSEGVWVRGPAGLVSFKRVSLSLLRVFMMLICGEPWHVLRMMLPGGLPASSVAPSLL